MHVPPQPLQRCKQVRGRAQVSKKIVVLADTEEAPDGIDAFFRHWNVAVLKGQINLQTAASARVGQGNAFCRADICTR